MCKKYQKIAFLFPGQGAQYPGMAQDFAQNFSAARLTFEEADTILKEPLSTIIFQGPEEILTQTKNSQLAIYVTSMAILRVVQELNDIQPHACAGLSLGEYTALTAGNWISFLHALPLVQLRARFMNESCEAIPGQMAVILGLDASAVEEAVRQVNLPNDLWVANYNCPGQLVISGTAKGIEAGTEAAKTFGAKRVLPLQVHGAFHSGLMHEAEKRLAPYIDQVALTESTIQLAMNVPGAFVNGLENVRRYLKEQITHSVRWEQGIREMVKAGIDLFIEFGPGKTLAGMHKRMGIQEPMLSIEKVEDLEQLKGIFS